MGAVGGNLDKKKIFHSISLTSEAGSSPPASPCEVALVDHFPFLSGEKIVPKVTFDRYPCLLKNLNGDSKRKKKKYDASLLSSPSCNDYKEHEDDILFSRYKKRLNEWIHGDETWASNSFSESFDFNDLNPYKSQATFTHLFSQIPFHSLNELLCVPRSLWLRLFPHQQKALEFLGTLHQNLMGCIIADEMGLGKTAQMIVFLGALHFSSYCRRNISCNSDFQDHTWGRSFLRNVLVLCPATLVQQWLRELHKWYPPFRCYLISSKCLSERDRFSRIIQEPGSVSIMSYETMRNGVMFFGTLSFTYVILDEGQKIRNPESGVTIAVKKLHAAYRIILSGTPIQNNLKEFWSLFDFVSPQRLGSLTLFTEKFADPIRAGGLANATHSQVLAAQKSAEELRSIISPYFLRRTKKATLDSTTLPEKSEHILFCHISPAQFQIYSEFIQHQRLMFSRKIYSRRQLFSLKRYLFFTLSVLRKICNHPDLLLEEQHRGLPEEIKDFGASDRSAKLLVTLKILETWYQNKHRVVVFSQTVQILNILQQHMKRLNYSFRRFDGTWSMHQRHKILQEFETDPTIFALLITTRVGGVGLNLTTANRLLIFDPDWNPVTDTQAKERSWRIGQKNDVIIYRLIVSGTIEEKIFQRQIFKYFLSQRVLVNPKQRRYFKMNDLEEFFQLPPKPPGWSDSEKEQDSNSCYVQQLRDSIDSWGTYEGTKDYEGFFEEDENSSVAQTNDGHQIVETTLGNTLHPENSHVEIQIPKRKQRSATLPLETFSENGNKVRNSHQSRHDKLFPPTSSRTKQQKQHKNDLLEYNRKDMASVSTSRESHLLATLQELQLVEGILSQDLFETSRTESENVNRSELDAAAGKKESPECTVSSLDDFSSWANSLMVQENFNPLTPSKNSVGSTMSLMEQWQQGSVEKKLFEAWTRDLEEKLFNFLSDQKQCSTEALLKKFSSEVNTQHNPDECKNVFKTLLKKFSCFDPVSGLWISHTMKPPPPKQ